MASTTTGFLQYVRTTRVKLTLDPPGLRAVYVSELTRMSSVGGAPTLNKYLIEKVPFFYKSPSAIASRIHQGYFATAFGEALLRIPTSQSFQESHFGEIVAGIVAEEVLGLRILYNKLRLTTAENSNPHKMDLLLYDPQPTEVELVFGEVKASPKDTAPANHHQVCFANLFSSLANYDADDETFDISAAADHLDNVPLEDRSRVVAALEPYSNARRRYAGFAVIDAATRADEELQILATRRSSKPFEVDVLCVERFGALALEVYDALGKMRKSVQ